MRALGIWGANLPRAVLVRSARARASRLGRTRGRETENKAIAAVAVEKNGRGLGRIRLRRTKAGLAKAGFQHQVPVISGASDPAHEAAKPGRDAVMQTRTADLHQQSCTTA